MASPADPSVCPRCAARLVEIRLAPGGAPLALRSCSRCDGRWWLRDGELTDLAGVLGDVARERRPRRRSA